MVRKYRRILAAFLLIAMLMPFAALGENGPEEPETTAAPAVQYRQLKSGSKGEDVTRLQERLKELGYYDSKCTGMMLANTVKAVKAFQRDHGLYPSGSADQKLIDLMWETGRTPEAENSEAEAPETEAPPAPETAVPPESPTPAPTPAS